MGEECCKEAYLSISTGSCSGMKVVDNVLIRCEKVEECLVRRIKENVDRNKIKK